MTTRKVKGRNGKVYEYDNIKKTKEEQDVENAYHRLNYTVIQVKKTDKLIFNECKKYMSDKKGSKLTFSQMFSMLCRKHLEDNNNENILTD